MTVDEIRSITIKTTIEGTPQATTELNKLADAQNKVADSSEKVKVVSDTQTRSHLSAASALEQWRRRVDAGYASQQNMTKGQDVFNRAEQQGLITGALHAELLGKLSERYSNVTRDTGKLAEVSAVIESRMAGLSANMGIVGAVMQVIGPYGLAAAAGLGAVVVTAVKLSEAANRMGDWARLLKDTSETIGLNTTQLQALDFAAERVGVNAEANATAFERFTVNLGGLKNGTGALYTQLEKVNPSLVDQLSVTKDNVVAWNLLARAYAQADEQQRALIAHAAFGRGAAAQGRVLLATNQAGGIDGADQANAFTRQQIEQWAALRTEISTTLSEAGRNIASIFTGPVLELEARFTNKFLEFSNEIKGFTPSQAWDKFVEQMLSLGDAKIDLGPFNAMFRQIDQGLGIQKMLDEYKHRAPTAQDVQILNGLESRMRGGGQSSISSRPSFRTAEGEGGLYSPAGGASLGVTAARTKDLVSVLGALAPIQLLVANEEDKIAEARERGVVISKRQEDQLLANARAQALGTAAMQQTIDTLRIEAATMNMGIGAATSYRMEQERIAEARRVGRPVFDADIAAWHREALAAGEAAAALERTKIAASIKFDRQTAFLGADDVAIAQKLKTLYGSDIPAALASTEAAQMRVNDALKQTNDMAGTFASGFLTDLSHGVSAVDSLRNALTRLADMLIDMATKQLVNAALGSLAGNIGSLGNSSGGSAGILPALHHSGGIVGLESSGSRYVHPAYFDAAPRFHAGGIAGDEVPIIAKRGEGVFTPAQMAAMGGGSSVVHNTTIQVDARGSTLTESQYIAITAKMIKASNAVRDRAAPNRLLNG